MRSKTKLFCAGVALAVSAVALNDAFAGNVAAPAASYEIFNLELDIGEGFQWAGGAIEAMVVDDITYTVDMDPCDVEARCLVLNDGVTGWSSDTENSNPGQTEIEPNGIKFRGPGYRVIRWAVANGTVFRANLWEQLVAGEVAPAQHFQFDAISHTIYGQMVGREHWRWKDGNGQLQSAGMGVGIGASVAISPSSQSRHYQTPYVLLVPDGSTVRFTQGILRPPPGVPVPANSAYNAARVFIKGRIFTDATDAPTRTANGNFTIQAPGT